MKTVVFEIIRFVCVALTVVLIVSYAMKNKVSNADIKDVAEAVTAQIETENMQQADNQMIKRLYGINPDDYEGCMLYYPNTNMDAEELLIVKLSDVSQQSDLLSAAEKRIDTQKKTFDGYGVEQFALLTDNSVIQASGNYFLLVVSKTSDKAKSAFLGAL